MSQINNGYMMPEYVDYTISCTKDGKKLIYSGRAEMDVNVECDFEDVYYDSLSPVKSVKTYDQTTITLKTVKTEPKPMEKIKTTRSIKVRDFSFATIAAARKKVGAPRTATFKFKDGVSSDSLVDVKEVVFEWDEVL